MKKLKAAFFSVLLAVCLAGNIFAENSVSSVNSTSGNLWEVVNWITGCITNSYCPARQCSLCSDRDFGCFPPPPDQPHPPASPPPGGPPAI